MAALPIADWHAALNQIDVHLTATLKSLDQNDDRWEQAGTSSVGEGERPPALNQLDTKLRNWEERLRQAEELAVAGEQELTERAAAVQHWRDLFARWMELLQQLPHI